MENISGRLIANLNTSYVLVQRGSRRPAISCHSYLNTSYVLVQPFLGGGRFFDQSEFKYILCLGSTLLQSQNALRLFNLNTSYVLVQQKRRKTIEPCGTNLNTSYVLVQQYIKQFGSDCWELFKYILCFGSTISEKLGHKSVTVFKYILCFGSTILSLPFNQDNN